MKTFGILGGGAWGTALAQIIASAETPTRLWMRDKTQVQALNQTHENKPYLPGIPLSPAIKATTDLSLLASCEILIAAIPAQKTRNVFEKFGKYIKQETPILLTSKGLEQGSLKFQSEILEELVPQALPIILSGPSFAQDVARGLPTALVLAGEIHSQRKPEKARLSSTDLSLSPKTQKSQKQTLRNGKAKILEVIKILGRKNFRPYLSTDILGVQIGGAVKNVLAIACGIVEGKALGRSAHAALMTRGFAEMMRLGQALGAQAETLSGLSGLGDLTLTCFSSQSRNMACGIRLGQGMPLQQIIAQSHSIEGVATAAALLRLAETRGVDMPIVRAVSEIVSEQKEIDDVIDELLSRPFRAEGGQREPI